MKVNFPKNLHKPLSFTSSDQNANNEPAGVLSGKSLFSNRLSSIEIIQSALTQVPPLWRVGLKIQSQVQREQDKFVEHLAKERFFDLVPVGVEILIYQIAREPKLKFFYEKILEAGVRLQLSGELEAAIIIYKGLLLKSFHVPAEVQQKASGYLRSLS